MEIPNNIISKSLKFVNSASQHAELKKLLQKLENLDIKEIVSEENANVSGIEHDIYQLIVNSVYANSSNEDNVINSISQIIFTHRDYLIKSIENAEIKFLLVYISVACYFNIELKDLLDAEYLEEQKTLNLAEKIKHFLMDIKMDIKALPVAPSYEIKLMDKFVEGFSNKDIKCTYEFIEALERGGRGFNFKYSIKQIILFLIQFNYSFFVKLLASFKKPQEFVFYLNNVKVKTLLDLSSEPLLTNNWFNLELIRQILKACKDEEIESNKQNAIQNAMSKIHQNDFDFLKQSIDYLISYNSFNHCLGAFMTSIKDSEIEDIISDCFKINQYSFNISARDHLLEQFRINSTDKQYELILSKVYEKWDNYYRGLLSNSEHYQNENLLTDYCNYIVQYLTLFSTEKGIISQLNKHLEKITHIDSEWAISSSKQLTRFHLYYSRFYLLTYAYKNKNLNNSRIVESFTKLAKNNICKLRYIHNNKDYFNIAKENLNCE